MSELDIDTGIGLIERVRQGLGRPSVIYVKHFISRQTIHPINSDSGTTKTQLLEVQNLNFRNSKNQTSRSSIIEHQEVQKLNFSYNNSYPYKSYLYLSINQSNQPMDEIDREKVKTCVQMNIGYVAFGEQQRPQVDELMELITDVLCSPQATFRIGGAPLKSAVVKIRLINLRQTHIEYVLDCMSKNTSQIRNIRGHLLTALYNAPATMEHYYQTQVQHDLYGQEYGP